MQNYSKNLLVIVTSVFVIGVSLLGHAFQTRHVCFSMHTSPNIVRIE